MRRLVLLLAGLGSLRCHGARRERARRVLGRPRRPPGGRRCARRCAAEDADGCRRCRRDGRATRRARPRRERRDRRLDFPKNVQLHRDAGARTTNVTFAWNDVERPYDAGAPASGDGGMRTRSHADAALQSPRPRREPRPAGRAHGRHPHGRSPRRRRPARPAELASPPARRRRARGALRPRARTTSSTSCRTREVTALFVRERRRRAARRRRGQARRLRDVRRRGRPPTSTPSRRRSRSASSSSAAGAIAAKELLGRGVGGLGRRRDHATCRSTRARGPARTSEARADLDQLTAALPAGKPIVLREAGYPTAAACGSDRGGAGRLRPRDVRRWDRHADRIPVVTFRELVDLEQAPRLRRSRSGWPLRCAVPRFSAVAGPSQPRDAKQAASAPLIA